MVLVSSDRIDDLSTYGLTGTAHVRLIHLRINEGDITFELRKLIENIQDVSWISGISSKTQRASFNSKTQRTINHLTAGIFSGTSSKITEETGEYLVSHAALTSLGNEHGHKKVPLAELWKQKKSGNPGFDFHTEHPEEIVIFGEAKYSGQVSVNPYGRALKQICEFIEDTKDIDDLAELEMILGISNSINKVIDSGIKGYAAAFSINSQNPETIFRNVLSCDDLQPLLNYPKIYLIGIEICQSR